MTQNDYANVVEEMRLASGLAWSLPITLAVDEDTARTAKEGSEVALVNGDGDPIATMLLQERYRVCMVPRRRAVVKMDGLLEVRGKFGRRGRFCAPPTRYWTL